LLREWEENPQSKPRSSVSAAGMSVWYPTDHYQSNCPFSVGTTNKDEYFRKREEEIKEREQKAKEMKSKYTPHGMKYTAIALASRPDK
jgi:hypothetical protein